MGFYQGDQHKRTVYSLLCKQGVAGSTPASSTAPTRANTLVGAREPRAKRALRVGCALGGLA